MLKSKKDAIKDSSFLLEEIANINGTQTSS